MSDYDHILPGNPHPGRAERARRLWDLANDGGDDRPDLLHRSQAEATLALAYEQRTANLIAVATAVSENGVYQLDPALIGAAQEELATRLGLGATK